MMRWLWGCLAGGIALGAGPGITLPIPARPTPTRVGQLLRGLRVSHRTQQPTQLVLRARKGTGYQEPVHWDFATRGAGGAAVEPAGGYSGGI